MKKITNRQIVQFFNMYSSQRMRAPRFHGIATVECVIVKLMLACLQIRTELILVLCDPIQNSDTYRIKYAAQKTD